MNIHLQHDSVVLQYQNQKLIQQLEAQNIEYSFLEKKLEQLKDRQKHYNHTLELVDMFWENVCISHFNI